jgi:hypothetical protein
MEIFSFDRGGIAVLINNVAVPAGADYYSDEVGIVASYSGFRLPNSVTWEWAFGGTGAFSTILILLEGSIDGLTWYQLDSSFSVLTSGMQHVMSKPVRYLRAHIPSTVAIASGAPTVHVQLTM